MEKLHACLHGLLLACVFVQVVARGYVITSPKRWVKNSASQVCFLMSEAAGPDDRVTISITTKDGYREKTFVSQTVEGSQLNAGQSGHGMSCIEPFLPRSDAIRAELHSFHVEGSLMGSKINETRRIKLAQEIKRTFIQTDKFMYKPGQLVKFRVLTAEGQFFKVSTEPYSEIFVETPSSSRIAQWLNVSNTRGLIHEELQLIEEPEKGTYKISIRSTPGAPAVVKEFVVDDYVLPRFEVKTKVPPYVLATDTELKIEVCATYTFGQPVRGRLEGSISNGGWGKYNVTVPIAEDIFGCTDVIVKLEEQLNINFYQNRASRIDIGFKFTEEGTDNSEEDSATVPIERQAITIENVKIAYLKPELPLICVLRATFPDDEPAALEPFEVCVDRTCVKTTSDSAGYLKFALPPHLLEGYYMSIEVKSVNFKDVKQYTAVPMPNTEGYRHSYDYSRRSQLDNVYLMYAPRTSFSIQRFFSPSNSSLIILPLPEEEIQCTPGGSVTIEIPVLFSANKTAEASLSVQLISRGQIQHSEVVPVTFSSSEFPESLNLLKPMKAANKDEIVRGVTSIKVSQPPVMSPTVQVMIWYTRSDGEVVADSRQFEMAKCLAHQVAMSWPSSKVEQGTTQPLQLKAEPDSLCSLGVVDKSVELFSANTDSLTINKLFDLLGRAEPENYDSDQIDDIEYCTSKMEHENDKSTDPLKEGGPPSRRIIEKRSSPPRFFPYRWRSEFFDAITAFDEAGLLIFSDQIYETRPCDKVIDPPIYLSSSSRGGEAFLDAIPFASIPASPSIDVASPGTTNPEPTTRSYFPETWLWQLVDITPEGEFIQDFKLPDTITQWVGKAVCVHPTKGVGLSAPTSITTFTPFFVDLTLLPTIRQGEIMPVVISVFNYLKTPLPVRVTLEPSSKYEIIEDGTTNAAADQNVAGTAFLCIPQDDKATATIKIRPVSVEDVYISVSANVEKSSFSDCSSLSDLPQKSDRVVKSLNVEYEGFPKEKTWTKYVCTDDVHENEDFVAKWTLEAPQGIVKESERSWISVVGDLLGPTLENLGHLIRMPTGCGEQNMITFSPNIYVLQYLEGAGLLNPITEEKLLKFMDRGYQRELNYRHADGSFSAWGPSDDSGSTWLTAFVVKSFAQSRPYITIDNDDLQISTDWLRNIQNADSGCFENRGRVLHKEMLGGISGDDQTMLSAFVLAALLEAGEDPMSEVVSNAFFCLKQGGSKADPYGMALRAYALSLAKHPDTDTALAELLSTATNSSDVVYWEVAKSSDSSHGKSTQVSPVAVETAGYVVLAMMHSDPDRYMQVARSIIKWISGQRNGQGGFISTQDTVIALQALALFESYQHQGPFNVDISAVGTNFSTSFKIEETNKLLNQRFDVPTIPTNLVIDMTGDGCALMQAVVRYNVPDPEPSEAFSISVSASTVPKSCKRMNLNACASYLLRDGKSNMAVIEVTLVSGYIPDKEHLKKIVGLGTGDVKRYEVDGNKIQFYIDEMTPKEICVKFDVLKEVDVADPKPGNVRVYDYYEPELVVTENYEFPVCDDPTAVLPDLF